MITKPGILLILCLFTSVPAWNQEKEDKITINGYLTSMQSVMFDSLSGPFLKDRKSVV